MSNAKKSPTEKISTPNINYKVLLTILLPSALLVMLISSFWFGLSGDEPYANGMGKAAWDFIKSFGQDRRIFDLPDTINRDGVLTYYGNIFDIMCIWLNWVSPFGEYTTRHLFNAFVGWTGIYYVVRIIRYYWSDSAAVIALIMMLLFPFYFGHAMNNPKDVPMAAFYIMGVFYSLMFFERYDQLRKRDYLYLIGAIILAIDVRISGLLLITYLPILFILDFKKFQVRAGEKGWFKSLYPIAIVAIVSYLGCSIFWPYAALNPISNPLNALDFLSQFKVPMPIIWEGGLINSMDRPDNYLIRSILITSPWVFLIGLLLGLVFLFLFWKKINNKKIVAFLLFTSIFPLAYIIYKHSNVYHLWRHVIFVIPALIVFASLGFDWLSRYVKLSFPIGLVLFGLLIMEPIIFTAKTFPNNVNYFNSMVDGVDGAYGNYDVDFYYNSMKPCIDYFEENVLAHAKDTVILGTNGYHLALQYFKDKYPKLRIEYVRYPEKNLKAWDYGIFHLALVPLDEIQNRIFTTYNNPIYIEEITEHPLCALFERPSNEDLIATTPIAGMLRGESDEPLTMETVNFVIDHLGKYLQKDPNNPMMKQLYDYFSGMKTTQPPQ